MDIAVCLKQTFDTEAKIVLENGSIREEGVQWIINPYDEYAIEEAILVREALGGTVTIVTIGPARVEEAVRTALAMGADDAVIVTDAPKAADGYTVSEILAAVLRKRPFDLVLAGNQAVDDGSGQVAVRLAQLLGIAHISTVTKLTVTGNQVIAHRDAEGNTEIVEASLPLLITAQQGLNEPRYPSLLGIRKAGKKPITRVTLSELGLEPECTEGRSLVLETTLPPTKQAGKVLQGDTSERVRQLIQELRSVSKVL